jgi:hypothetical protein
MYVDVINISIILIRPSSAMIFCRYFKEYSSSLSGDDLRWAREHLEDFEAWSAKETIARSTIRRGFIVVGEKELEGWPDFKQWVEDLRAQTKWPVTVVPGTSHEIEAAPHRQAVHTIIQSLA